MERRLAAILAADVVGYSRLMEADEAGTHSALRDHLQEVINPKIDEYHGRIVKLTGDGALAEFSSVVNAVVCAAEIQQMMTARNAEVQVDSRIAFRIGINVGDILIDADDIFGDGVNVASRLEGLAEPGGICLSGDAYRQVRGKIEAEFEDLGERQVKNLLEPLRVYRINMARSTTAVPLSATKPPPLTEKPTIAVLPLNHYRLTSVGLWGAWFSMY